MFKEATIWMTENVNLDKCRSRNVFQQVTTNLFFGVVEHNIFVVNNGSIKGSIDDGWGR